MQRTEKTDTEIYTSVYSVRLAMGWITRVWFLAEAGTVLNVDKNRDHSVSHPVGTRGPDFDFKEAAAWSSLQI
jgi:hypothetical protein